MTNNNCIEHKSEEMVADIWQYNSSESYYRIES